MRPRFQAAENLNSRIIPGLLRGEPAVDFQTGTAAGILGLSDPEVAYGAREGRIIVSHDRKTMPGHFSRYVVVSTSAGLLVVSQTLDIREAIEAIILIWAASEAEEWVNRIG
jgi:hypothetical protein